MPSFAERQYVAWLELFYEYEREAARRWWECKDVDAFNQWREGHWKEMGKKFAEIQDSLRTESPQRCWW